VCLGGAFRKEYQKLALAIPAGSGLEPPGRVLESGEWALIEALLCRRGWNLFWAGRPHSQLPVCTRLIQSLIPPKSRRSS
jgi:hypothetical protein